MEGIDEFGGNLEQGVDTADALLFGSEY